VPEGLYSPPFARWLPAGFSPNVRGEMFYVAMASKLCVACGSPTEMVTFVLPAPCFILNPADDEWELYDDLDFILNGVYWPPSVAIKAAQSANPHYRQRKGKARSGKTRYFNYCPARGAEQPKPRSGGKHVFMPVLNTDFSCARQQRGPIPRTPCCAQVRPRFL
jgi:hypothetical protein